jgi:hypothetical protein
MKPPENTFVTNTMKPAIPKNTPITTRNELETAFAWVMLLIANKKTIRPKRHKMNPTNTPLASNLVTD